MRKIISVIGLGYVGLCTAVCFAARGYKVISSDIETNKIELIGKGAPPFYARAKRISNKIIKVGDIIEKPSSPPSNIAVVGAYVFNSRIFRAIEITEPDKNNEVQLTDAIRQLMNEGNDVYAIELNRDQKRVDIGTPASYWIALKSTLSQFNFEKV